MLAEDMQQCDKLKKFLFAEFKLTPREYKSRFDTAHKNADETYDIVYCLPHVYAICYRTIYGVACRQVDNFDKLCELIVLYRSYESMYARGTSKPCAIDRG